jgi:hypothetical protein
LQMGHSMLLTPFVCYLVFIPRSGERYLGAGFSARKKFEKNY